LPDPECWSPQFNDFISLCLLKDPELRPGAADLLTHPFIVRAAEKGNTSFMELVGECMPAIEAFREREVKEAQEAQEAASHLAEAVKAGASVEVDEALAANATLAYGMGNKIDLGTLLQKDGVDCSTILQESYSTMLVNEADGYSTMVVNPEREDGFDGYAAAMERRANEEAEEDIDGYSTMVAHADSGQEGAANDAHVAEYMSFALKHIKKKGDTLKRGELPGKNGENGENGENGVVWNSGAMAVTPRARACAQSEPCEDTQV
jgi:hypothetical protein